ncbi:hypothetical protein [Vibrio phage BX-1]|nr:hypothetical protein [Vibrio phage BX-1]
MVNKRTKGQVKKPLELSHWEQMEFESALPTYQTYMGMKLHFKQGVKYDWFEYGSQVNLKVESLYKARGRQQILKLHKRFSQLPEEHLIAHLAANFIHDPNMWLLDLLKKDADQRASEFRSVIENFTYRFRTFMNDSMLDYAEAKGLSFMGLYRPTSGSEHTWLLKALLAEKLPWWFVVGLNRVTSFVSVYDKIYANDMFWPTISDHIKQIQGFYVFDHESAQRWLIQEINRRDLK